MYKKLVLITSFTMAKLVLILIIGCLFASLAVAQVSYVRHHRHHRYWRRRIILRNVKAGPIWNNIDAQNKCPVICRRAGSKWTGKWHTVRYGRQSVCECRMIKIY